MENKALYNKCVYKVKEEYDGSKRYKVRLVVKGFQQEEGIDYTNICSLVVKLNTIRSILILIEEEELHLERFDVKTKFLHGDLEEEIYMQQLEGFLVKGKEKLMCKLKKNLYDLNQAPRQCQEKKPSKLNSNNIFKSSHSLNLDMEQLKSCVEVEKRQFPITEVQNSLKEEVLQLQKQLDNQFDVRCALEKALCCSPLPHNPTNENSVTKKAQDLIREIAVLELEVVHLEKYLLSLYRKMFDQRFSSLPTNTTDKKSLKSIMHKGSSSDSGKNKNLLSIEYPPAKECNDIWGEKALLDSSTIHRSHSSLSQRSPCAITTVPPWRILAEAVDSFHSLPLSMLERAQGGRSNVLSLAEHLGSYSSDHVPETPNWLSEEMIKSISAIYCQLADPPLINQGFPSSPISFPSPMSESSPQVHYDMWSPECRGNSSFRSWLDNPFNVEGSKEFSGPYFTMAEVQRISRDRPKSRETEHMLQRFRSLVSRLEEVDPKWMKHEEKLAFWINIHNALVMHAFLVYGIPQNNLRRISLLLKAAYNVGGLIISIGMLQNSILGCRLPRPGQWFQSLLFPRTKFKVGDARKTYAINQPEPLLHFALCSGSHSDPAVRMYTPKRVFQELEAAKEEYIYTTFRVHKEQKILLPKIVDSFAKESDLCPAGLMELIEHSVSNSLRKSHHAKFRKKIEFIPHNFKFRYLISQELTK
ncbi:uncharacterized protein LOC132301727 [Cornus florida]|uniref:uncharacterized protein LOC132301727 n=1 Tax=Cornus florida TaxID=4283 RepID=UPI00289EC131|nr:uncharacterized protein LOC132301727 [Cornus florida]